MVEFWLNICKIRPPAADNLDDKSIVSEKAAQIYPDLSLADQIWYLENGQLVEFGSPQEVLQGNGPTAQFFQSRQAALLSK